ncbi:hypothetical protein ACSQ67_024060 [Phaseolus vulgaris]
MNKDISLLIPRASDYRGTIITDPNMTRFVVRAVGVDSHYFLNTGMTQHHGVRDQTNLDIGVSVSSNASHTEIGIGIPLNLPEGIYDVIVQENPSFLDQHNDMRLDIDNESYEASLLYECGLSMR